MGWILYRLLGLGVSGSLAFLFYRLDERAAAKGNCIRSRWGGSKFTLWSLPFYFSFIFLLIFAAAVIGALS